MRRSLAASPRREGDGAAPPAKPKPSDLPARVAAGLAMMVLALGAVWAGPYWFMLFWLIAAALLNFEWQGLINEDRRAFRVAIGALALAAAAPLSLNGFPAWAGLALMLGGGVAALSAGPRSLWPVGGVLYAGAMLVAVCLLRASEPHGARAILWLFALVWGTDVMAYFGGRFIGGPKLWPRISPGKTWSGFLVGIVCGAAFGSFLAPSRSDAPALFAVGVVGGAIAQGGDLFESAIKRHFGVKDSSHLIPGHGGLMDRLDGFIAAAIFAAVLGFIRGGVTGAAQGVLMW